MLDILDKNSSGFSFLSVFFDLVGNREFKRAQLSSLYTDAETSETSFWRALSAVASETGEEIVSNILHFSDSVADVDTCKVPQLYSMATALGVELDGWRQYCAMPLELQKLVDFLSMKREALLDRTLVEDKLADTVLSGADLDGISHPLSSMLASCGADGSLDRSAGTAWRRAFTMSNWRQHWAAAYPDMSSYWDVSTAVSAQAQIDDSKLSAFTAAAVSSLLFQKVSQTYQDLDGQRVYERLSSSALLSNFTLPDFSVDNLSAYKIESGIPNAFDEKTEADKYENFTTTSADYSARELSLIQMEIAQREAPLYVSQIKTRYRYYREKDVAQWCQFIEREDNLLSSMSQIALLDRYQLDDSYYVAANRSLSSSLFCETEQGGIKLQMETIYRVAANVAKTIVSIRTAREQLKLNSQQLSLKGSKQHLSWLIRDYLQRIANALPQKIPVSAIDGTEVDIIRYYDLNRYFNISSESDARLLLDSELSSEVVQHLSSLNSRPASRVGADGIAMLAAKQSDIVDDLMSEAQSAPWSIDALSRSDVSAFYAKRLSATLDGKDQRDRANADRLDKFLSTVVDVGAEDTFDYFGHTVIWDAPQLEAEKRALQSKLSRAVDSLCAAWKNVSSKLGRSPQLDLSDYCYSDQPVSKQLQRMQTDADGLDYLDKLNVYSTGIFDDVSAMQEALQQIDIAMDCMPVSAAAEAAQQKANAAVAAKESAIAEAAEKTDTFLLRRSLSQLELQYAALSVLCPDGLDLPGDTFGEQMSLLLSGDTLSVASVLKSLNLPPAASQFSSLPDSSTLAADARRQDWAKAAADANAVVAAAAQMADYFISSGQPSRLADVSSMRETAGRAAARIDAAVNLSATLSESKRSSLSAGIEPTSGSLTSVYEEARQVSAAKLYEIENTEESRYRKSLYEKYCLMRSDTPWYSFADSWHPSFLVHPDVRSFQRETPDYAIPEADPFSLAEAKSRLSAVPISSWIDADGYLKDVWNSPVCGNQPWLSRYEQSTHENSYGKSSPCIAYDGLFYPPALVSFISGGIFTADPQTLGIADISQIAGYPRSTELSGMQLSDIFTATGFRGTFTQALNGVDIDTGYSSSHAQWNPWYSHLDLTRSECADIARRLDLFAAISGSFFEDFSSANSKNRRYSITKYGVDAYGNAWTLLRRSSGSGDYQTLWLRLADHPIGFPAFIADCSQHTLLDVAPVKMRLDVSKLSMQRLEENRSEAFVQVSDFELSQDGQTILIAFSSADSEQDEAEVSIASIARVSDGTARMWLDTSRYCRSSFFCSGKLLKLFSDSGQHGALLESKSRDAHGETTVHGVLTDGETQIRVLPVSLPVPDDSKLAVDARDGKIAVAWTRWADESEKYVDYLSGDAHPGTARPEMENVVVETREYKLYGRQLIQTKSKMYAANADIGYFGLLSSGDSEADRKYVNDFSDSVYASSLLKRDGFYRFQILAPDKEKSIDYVPIAAVRMSEDFGSQPSALQKISTPHHVFYAANYLDARAHEGCAAESSAAICTPQSFASLLSGRSASLREDEHWSSHQTLNESALCAAASVGTPQWPYLYWSASTANGPLTSPSEPPAIWTTSADILSGVSDDNCVLRIAKKILAPDLSTSWHRWTDSDEKCHIQLDFNTDFYRSAKLRRGANALQSFLTLHKAGDSGKLNIYRDPLSGDFTFLGSYYIKNVSDAQPKFILSAEFTSDAPDADVLISEQYTFVGGKVEPMFMVLESSISASTDEDCDKLAIVAGSKTN